MPFLERSSRIEYDFCLEFDAEHPGPTAAELQNGIKGWIRHKWGRMEFTGIAYTVAGEYDYRGNGKLYFKTYPPIIQ